MGKSNLSPQRESSGFVGGKAALEAYKEQVNKPERYNQYPIEVIDMMIAIWGKEKVKDFCIMNAFKYRMRMGHKDSPDAEKEKWYLDKAKEL